MVRSNSLLSFDLHTNVHPDGSWHSRLVSSLVCQIKVRHKWLFSWLTSVPSTGEKHFNYHFLVLIPLQLAAPLICLCHLFTRLENSPKLYQTSISPLRVRTSMIVWPRKSSLSRLNLCFTRDLMSSSSSQTRTLMRSDELWHSLDEVETQIVGKQRKSTTMTQRNKNVIARVYDPTQKIWDISR